jgi:hypothetical protein
MKLSTLLIDSFLIIKVLIYKSISFFMKKHLFSLIFFSLSIFFSQAHASCARIATVKYQKQYGWSKTYSVEVNFLSGYELNIATNSYNYSAYSNYAVIFWAQGQASIIKIKSYLPCGTDITCDCIDNVRFDLQGHDQDGDLWNICLGRFCF